ncbi:biogenesis of lysosome-related organelles complex 1 subunit 4 isoform X2 [Narcine bancroftii]|uniref:biogenesis of lysosome-related organelles complex 1 subunit 4 isoform X2 n=1 Tax=Narcine bancroftii TaxID=1343680 RepID=UPI0038315DD0
MAETWAGALNDVGSPGSPGGVSTGQEEEGEELHGPGSAAKKSPGPGWPPALSEHEALLQRTAHFYSDCLTANAGQEIQQLEMCLEEMLSKVDEFCGMLDMIRNDSSQIMNENIPEIHAKADEMKQMYKKIDKLEAFVKMIGQNLSALDDQVTQAEAELGSFPSAFRKILHSFSTSAFFNSFLEEQWG